MSTHATAWGLADIPSLAGKIILVTGGNTGLGYETVKVFAEKGAEVILACRTLDKGEAAKASIGQVSGTITVMALDLASLASVKAFADAFAQAYSRLDVLVNNAGIMMTPYGKTQDGLEQQQGVNHFGHFALTAQLFELLKATAGARIVNVSSLAHKRGDMDWDNLMFNDGAEYTPMRAYGRSKLENLLFTYELQRRIKAAGLDIEALAAHPGGSKTDLARHVEGKLIFRLLTPLLLVMMQSAAAGALPQIRASVDAKAQGGEYYGPNKMGEMRGKPVLVPSTPESQSEEAGRRLWEVSEKLTGVTFSI
ncbi:MAG: oxidoreductase [Bacteroidota bacterium]